MFCLSSTECSEVATYNYVYPAYGRPLSLTPLAGNFSDSAPQNRHHTPTPVLQKQYSLRSGTLGRLPQHSVRTGTLTSRHRDSLNHWRRHLDCDLLDALKVQESHGMLPSIVTSGQTS